MLCVLLKLVYKHVSFIMQKNTVKKIHILKDSRGLGVQISMKLNHATGEKGVFVSDVSPGGAAAR